MFFYVQFNIGSNTLITCEFILLCDLLTIGASFAALKFDLNSQRELKFNAITTILYTVTSHYYIGVFIQPS